MWKRGRGARMAARPVIASPSVMLMTPPRKEPILPRWIRARAGVRLRIGAGPRGGAPLEIAERGGYRVRFARGATCEGIYVNTGGGMAGGDVIDLAASLDPHARATLTTQAAEKVYRADDAPTQVGVAIDLGADARLDWLPQEQILYDGARLSRRIDVAMADTARLLMVESVVFGRLAMGERAVSGLLRDVWRIRRGGRLVLAEEVRLDGAIADILDRPACGGGARALATVLLVAPDAEARVEEARALLADATCECGAGALDGMLVARFVGRDPQSLRADLARFLEGLRGRALPRSWQT